MNWLDRRQMKINMGMTIPILLAMFISCKNQERIKPEGFVERTVFLEDDYPDTPFCTVNLFIPPEFDTLLKWVDYSDCTCCDLKKYRFTSSKGCLIQESGFLKVHFCRDSFTRLTIENGCVGRDETVIDTAFLNNIYKYVNMKNSEMGFSNPEWQAQEIKYINRIPFAILHYSCQEWYTEKPFELIMAMTVFRNTVIVFRLECCQPDCTDFSTNAYQILQSIHIGPN